MLLKNSTDIKDILCQEWVQKDDANDLKEFDDNSLLLLSIQSFNFFEDGSFVKNYRSNWSYGNWKFNDEDKIITLNYKNENESGSYKITAIATDELNYLSFARKNFFSKWSFNPATYKESCIVSKNNELAKILGNSN